MAVQAIVADPDVPATMHLHQVQEPSPGPGQVVIAVQYISLNFGDLNDARSGRVPPGAVLGSDVAGVVTQAAGNGTGPRVGTRVVALANGGFGSLQSIGWTSGQPAVFPAYATIGPAKTLSSYLTYGPVGADLRTLVDLLAAGDLVVKVGWRSGWDQVSEAVSQMRDRKVNGKAVLDVPADTPDPG